jgi:hypothetical protein
VKGGWISLDGGENLIEDVDASKREDAWRGRMPGERADFERWLFYSIELNSPACLRCR